METTTDLYNIYLLVDPFVNAVFYVGIAINPIERFITHLKCTEDNIAKNERIQKIFNQGSTPVMYVLPNPLPKKEALIEEAGTIELFHAIGHALTNQSLRLGYDYSPNLKTHILEVQKLNAKVAIKRSKWYVRLIAWIYRLDDGKAMWIPPPPRNVKEPIKYKEAIRRDFILD